MRNLALTLLLVAGVYSIGTAQVFVQNTMYNYNRFVYNPAAAGLGQVGLADGMNLTLLGRLQWLGIDGGPNLSAINFHSPIESISSGLGASILSDQLGPLTTTGLNVAYAFHQPIGRNTLSFGVNGGMLQKSLNANWQYFGDEDPRVPLGQYNASLIVPSLGAGIFFRGADDRYFVGISGQDLLEPSIDDLLLSTSGMESKVTRTFYLSAGYSLEINKKSSIDPQVFLRYDGTGLPQADLSLYWNYKPVVFGGSYRFFNDSFSAIFGVNVLDRTFIAYSYDYTLSSLNALRDVSSHELIISFTFPTKGSEAGKVKDILDNVDDR